MFRPIARRVSTGLLALSVVLSGCSRQAVSITAPSSTDGLAPLVLAQDPARGIPGEYIVVYRSAMRGAEAEAMTREYAGRLSLKPRQQFRHALRGFHSALDAATLDELRHDPRVAYIEQNQRVSLAVTQNGPTWGLDRSDQVATPLDRVYNYSQTGAGVDAYIIDTGIRLTHSEFGGRAITGYDAVTVGGTAVDANGHGTHVAGTVGGATYGVAKGVRLIAVRVLDASGSGTTAGVVAGVDWVTGDHTTRPAVANMSLGGGTSATLDAAVSNSIADGVVYCIAAGNSAFDASTQSPARVPEAITVAASDSLDRFANFSNYGSIVDLIAPGVAITSSWLTSDAALNTISGTSMATPHVCGAAALVLEANPAYSPAEVAGVLTSTASVGSVSLVPSGTVNRLLYTAAAAAPPPPAPVEPVLALPVDLATGVSTSPTLSWNASTGASTYRLQVSTSATFATIAIDRANLTTLSSALTGLAGSTTHYWRVSASNAGGSSAFSVPFRFTTAAAPPAAPATPTLVSPVNGAKLTTRTPTLLWNASARAVTYRVQISTSNSFRTVNFDNATLTATSVVTPLLATKTTYYWRVSASNSGGTSAFSTILKFSTP